MKFSIAFGDDKLVRIGEDQYRMEDIFLPIDTCLPVATRFSVTTLNFTAININNPDDQIDIGLPVVVS